MMSDMLLYYVKPLIYSMVFIFQLSFILPFVLRSQNTILGCNFCIRSTYSVVVRFGSKGATIAPISKDPRSILV